MLKLCVNSEYDIARSVGPPLVLLFCAAAYGPHDPTVTCPVMRSALWV